MSVTKRWQAHIEAWERSRLTQTAYCQQHQLNKRSFTARLSEHRRQGKPSLPTFMPVTIETTDAVAKEAGVIQLYLAQGHRLEVPATVSAQWLSMFLRGLE
jgi:hypothetical protein